MHNYYITLLNNKLSNLVKDQVFYALQFIHARELLVVSSGSIWVIHAKLEYNKINTTDCTSMYSENSFVAFGNATHVLTTTQIVNNSWYFSIALYCDGTMDNKATSYHLVSIRGGRKARNKVWISKWNSAHWTSELITVLVNMALYAHVFVTFSVEVCTLCTWTCYILFVYSLSYHECLTVGQIQKN